MVWEAPQKLNPELKFIGGFSYCLKVKAPRFEICLQGFTLVSSVSHPPSLKGQRQLPGPPPHHACFYWAVLSRERCPRVEAPTCLWTLAQRRKGGMAAACKCPEWGSSATPALLPRKWWSSALLRTSQGARGLVEFSPNYSTQERICLQISSCKKLWGFWTDAEEISCSSLWRKADST